MRRPDRGDRGLLLLTRQVEREHQHVGPQGAALADRLLDRRRLPDHLEIALVLEQPDETPSVDGLAVCDHQVAHVYVREAAEIPKVGELLQAVAGIAQVLHGEERATVQLAHRRAGDLVLLAQPHAWFAYPFWLEERNAPDYARTVDIHRKPGYDPAEVTPQVQYRWLANPGGSTYSMTVSVQIRYGHPLYVPIVSKTTGQVVGVVEVSKSPLRLLWRVCSRPPASAPSM